MEPNDTGLASSATDGAAALPDHTGDLDQRAGLTGDWNGVRREWAETGIVVGLDLTTIYQDIVDGGIEGGSGLATNIDYRAALDLGRMGAVPGAAISVRAQSLFGDTVNERVGVILPVNMYSAYPIRSTPNEDIPFALTEFNWTQEVSESVGVMAGKITTLGTTNEFMGGEGRSQFMNFQLNFSAALAQVTPYSTLAAGVSWDASPVWTLSTTVMNYSDASTSSGLDDIGEGTTWATNIDYLGSVNALPGGGGVAFYYAFDSDFARIGGVHLDPGATAVAPTESSSWALSWSGWQYITAEDSTAAVDPSNGRQDLQGLGLFAQFGVADRDTNPVSWSATAGVSGRGSIPGRDADTWGAGAFFNDLQELRGDSTTLGGSTGGFELYYDIAFAPSVLLTLDAQWLQGALSGVRDATILGLRLNVSL